MHSIATNQQVADAIGVDVSMASRLRSGSRNPSLMTMMKIEEVFHWTLRDQATAIQEDAYGRGFEEVLGNRYGVGTAQG